MDLNIRKHLVTFLPSGQQIYVSNGCTLLETARLAGIQIDAPCAGNGICGKCIVTIYTETGNKQVKACSYKVTETMTVELPDSNPSMDILTDAYLISESISIKPLPISDVNPGYLAACDLGSTTIVLYLIDGNTGKILTTSSAQNPQTVYSADVIGRIAYAKKHGASILTSSVRNVLNDLLLNACSLAKISTDQVTHLCVVGNCCMHHLYFGISTDSLATLPYAPTVTEAMVIPASDVGILMHPQGIVQSLPNIAGFVGADTAACLSAAQFDILNDITLLLDIGTNGELVLGNKNRRLACSTAAGPALEGARISKGMRGTTGAIDHVWIENQKIVFSVIGNQNNPDIKPLGFCGSGLIDAVSVFLELGILDASGKFTDSKNWPDPSAHRKKEQMISYSFTNDVFITQKDIREIQLAKAAIAAGIQLMCNQLGIQPKEIRQVLIAGAFGNYMDPSSACRIGLIPSILRDRILPIGNAAGAGACRCVCNAAEFERIQKTVSETQFLELASLDDFQDVFIDELGFEMV